MGVPVSIKVPGAAAPFRSIREAAIYIGVSHVAMSKAYNKGEEYFEMWLDRHLELIGDPEELDSP